MCPCVSLHVRVGLQSTIDRGILTEYGLQHSRYEEHGLAAEFVRKITGDDATRCHTQQKKHFGHIFQILLVAHQVPLGGPTVPHVIVDGILPG